MVKHTCYGCGRSKESFPYLELCKTCQRYYNKTGHNPNKLGYEDAIKELRKRLGEEEQ